MNMYQQDYKSVVIREDAVLTNSYVECDVVSAPDFKMNLLNQLLLYVDFTIGSLTSADIIVEFSDDGVNYYQESLEDVPTAGVSVIEKYVRRMDATGTYRFAIPIKDKHVKVSAKGNGTVTDSSMLITAIVGVA